MEYRVFLFGESQKGEMCTPCRLRSLEELEEKFGQPAENSIGIDYAVQTLLYQRELIFYRVHEEGFSREDYLRGIKLLYNHGQKMKLTAICLPGVGDRHIIESLSPICKKNKTILILSEKDLYDYLTETRI